MDFRQTPTFLDVEYYPDLTMEKYNPDTNPGFPIDKLGALSASFKPLSELVQTIMTKGGGSGLYRVNTKGLFMSKAKDGSGYLGILQGANKKIAAQASLTKVAIDPVSIALALTTMVIEQKLNAINEGQKNILEFLELKEKIKIKANINTLIEIINNYKYNYNNSQYRNSNHILVRNIKKEADESMLLFESILLKEAKQKGGFQLDKKVEEYISDAVDKLNEYQLSLYAFTFASLLDIILLENYDKKFIDSMLDIINKAQQKYHETFKIIENKIEKDSSGSVQTSLIKGVSKINKTLGKLVTKTPLIGRTKLDKNLMASGDKLSNATEEKIASKINILSETRKDLINPLIENIKMINLIYNDKVNLLIAADKVYLEV